jgi:SAM-dependent methyltransferase
MGAVELVAPVLDIGCGDGHFASIAYDTPIDVGIDLSRPEVAEAGARGREVYRHVMVASATDLPFPDASFSTVLSNCAIEHMPDLDRVLSEIARVLRPGGTFATTLPSEHFADMLLGSTVLRRLRLHRGAAAYGRFFHRISHHHHVDPPDTWRRRLAAYALEMDEHQYYFSARSHRRFDASHYLGVPNLVTRKLTGRWVLHPIHGRLFDRWLRPSYDEPLPQPIGAYQYVRCTRVG